MAQRRVKKGRPLYEPPPGAPRRGYDRRHDKDVDPLKISTQAWAASLLFAEAMKGRA